MKGGMRLAMALGFLGATVMAVAAFGHPRGSGEEAQGLGRSRSDESRPEWGRDRGRAHRRGFRHLVHGKMKIQTADGFAMVLTDLGEVTAVDPETLTLTIVRADDESVTVTANDETKIGKDRERATFQDIEVGDHARIVQVDEGEGYSVRLILVRTPSEGEEEAAGPAEELAA